MKLVFLRYFRNFGKTPLCNNNIESCIFIGDFCLPLCSRCLSFSLSVIVFSKFALFNISSLYFSIGFILPCLLDGVFQYFFGLKSNNYKRIVTGFLAGFGCVNLLNNL